MRFIIILLLLPFLGTSQETEQHMVRVEIVKDTIIIQSGFAESPETIDIKGQTYVALTRQEVEAWEANLFYLIEEKKIYIQKGLIIPKQ